MKMFGLTSVCLLFLLSTVAGAENLTFLNSSDLAVAQRYVDIGSATQTIDLTTLEWDPCSTIAKVMTKKIREKAMGTPKVKVRLLIDSYFQWKKGGNKLLSQMQTYYGQQGFDIKFVNPPGMILPFDLSQLTGGNTRSHSKLLVIDGKSRSRGKFISGGRNMTDQYFGMAKENLMDRDVAVNTGSAVTDATYGFDALWDNDKMTKAVGAASAQDMQAFQACTKWGPREAKLEAFLKANAAKLLSQAKHSKCSDVSFAIDSMSHAVGGAAGVPDTSSVFLRNKPATAAVFSLLRGANRTLTMENQYYIPVGTIESILQEKRAHKVKIRLYTNMFDGSDEAVRGEQAKEVVQDNTGTQHNESLSRISGMIDKWEFTPPGATYRIHSKTFVADGKDAIVSSFNIDPRSTDTNGETALTTRNCPAFAKQVEDSANLTASIWKLEERIGECRGGAHPAPAAPGPFDWLILPALL